MNLISAHLDPASRVPLYIQLHDHLAFEISSGGIREHERLPGRRQAAKLLGVSLSTVDSAYQLLASEGYIISHPRSGFTACRIEPLSPPVVSEPSIPALPHETPSSPLCSFETGGMDTSLFPFKTWGRLFKDALYNRPDLLNRGDPCGDADLREAISLYLHHSRGVACTSDRIIVGAGMEYLLGLLCHLLKGRRAAVEDPGYPKIHQILGSFGMEVSFIPLDKYGMEPEALARSGADIAYLTPSHQFPTGAVTPAGRRTELLKWASDRPGRYVIEDDYDSEFRFDGRPMPCMQTLDPIRVIYIGTFSRTIAPAIRIAYMVLPPALMEQYRRDFTFFSSTVSRFEQQALRRYIAEGHFGRSLSRMKNRYRDRRDMLIAALHDAFGQDCRLENTHTGLSFLFRSGSMTPEEVVSRRARELGLAVNGLDLYRFLPAATPHPACFVLGFGTLDEKSIPAAVGLLKRAIYDI